MLPGKQTTFCRPHLDPVASLNLAKLITDSAKALLRNKQIDCICTVLYGGARYQQKQQFNFATQIKQFHH